MTEKVCFQNRVGSVITCLLDQVLNDIKKDDPTLVL